MCRLEPLNPGTAVTYLPHSTPGDNCLAKIKKLSSSSSSYKKVQLVFYLDALIAANKHISSYHCTFILGYKNIQYGEDQLVLMFYLDALIVANPSCPFSHFRYSNNFIFSVAAKGIMVYYQHVFSIQPFFSCFITINIGFRSASGIANSDAFVYLFLL